MNRAEFVLPPVKTVDAALRKTTEFLARELAHPGSEAPQWSAFEWRIAQAAAALHGISALLSDVLSWRGPDHWQAFLLEQKTHTLLRQQRIEELLARIDLQARNAGVAMVALKGAALHEIGIYRAGERPMGDVDLLVDSADLEGSARLLRVTGYVESFTNWRHTVLEPVETRRPVGFGEHVDNPIKIELHTRIMERLPFLETDITSLEFPARAHAGLNPYPSRAALMRHLLLHAAGNMRPRTLRLIQLHDIALLAVRMEAADWEELWNTTAGKRGLWWALPPLTLAARYYPTAIPPSIIAPLEPGCPRLLKLASRRHRLVDVSWSRVRVQAFPGIEWSESLREAFMFAKSRVWPSRTALAELANAVASQPSSRIPWYAQSHGTRIVRWLFSRPPRVQTIFSVRSALGCEP
jgi:hypothetical protein